MAVDDGGAPPKAKPAATSPDVDASELPAVLTVEELAAFLRLNRKTVYECLSRGEIPGVRRLGRTIRINRDAVLGWLSTGQGRVSRSGR